MKLLSTIFLFTILIHPSSAYAAEKQNAQTQNEDGKAYISWEQVHKDAQALAEKLKDKGPFVGIVAVARGGLVPATIVAHRLKIKRMEVFSLTSYNGDKQQNSFVVLKEFKDIVDSKKYTYKKLAEDYPQPEWCNYPGATEGIMGCWSLMSHMVKNKNFCRNCDQIKT